MSASDTPSAEAGASGAVAPLPPWQRFICRACGYIYDEAKGDPDGGLAPGTRYADIPDDWACPLCGVTKADFDPINPDAGTEGPGAQCWAGFVQGRSGGRGQPEGVVIVGAGRAGWQVAEALRAGDAGLPITLVTACDGAVYDKPVLSVAMARGLAPGQLVRERGTDAALRLGVRLLAHTSAVRICTDTRTLRTTRGPLRYAHLVLAHGARPVLPSALPPGRVWRLNHLEAYRRFRAALGEAPSAVAIVGAGLVGCELANDLALAGHRVTLLDTEAEPLSRWSAGGAGVRVLQAWDGLPIRFVGGADVTRLEPVGARLRLHTACGQVFEVDQVVAAIGLQTPSRLADSAGLAWNQGIAVDAATMQTSVGGIHALGDCVSVEGRTSRFIEPIDRQARALAAALLGRSPAPYEHRTAPVRLKATSCPLTLH